MYGTRGCYAGKYRPFVSVSHTFSMGQSVCVLTLHVCQPPPGGARVCLPKYYFFHFLSINLLLFNLFTFVFSLIHNNILCYYFLSSFDWTALNPTVIISYTLIKKVNIFS